MKKTINAGGVAAPNSCPKRYAFNSASRRQALPVGPRFSHSLTSTDLRQRMRYTMLGMTVAVVAEKPSVGRDLAQALGATRRAEGTLSGNGYVVTWAIGHLVGLAEPEGIR